MQGGLMVSVLPATVLLLLKCMPPYPIAIPK
jgi:hypothetical protein